MKTLLVYLSVKFSKPIVLTHFSPRFHFYTPCKLQMNISLKWEVQNGQTQLINSSAFADEFFDCV